MRTKTKLLLVFSKYKTSSPNLVFTTNDREEAYDFIKKPPPRNCKYLIQEFPNVEISFKEEETV